MKQKLSGILLVVLLLLIMKLSINLAINRFVLYKYEEEVYQKNNAKLLMKFCQIEKYVPYYNLGNMEYLERKL